MHLIHVTAADYSGVTDVDGGLKTVLLFSYKMGKDQPVVEILFKALEQEGELKYDDTSRRSGIRSHVDHYPLCCMEGCIGGRPSLRRTLLSLSNRRLSLL